MTDVDLTALADVPNRTAAGQEAIAFPDMIEVEGQPDVVEKPVRLRACSACTKKALHNCTKKIAFSPPHGEHRYQRVPEANRPTKAVIDRIQKSFHLMGFAAWGLIGDDVIYNAGGGNNGSQRVVYEIVGASGDTLTLRGPNPKNILIGSLRANPNYPLPDPQTGVTSALVPEGFEITLPVGGAVEFLSESVLTNKLVPMVVGITLPASDDLEDDVTFGLKTNCQVGNAMRPIDLAYPPDSYHCIVRFEALAPDFYLNVQGLVDAQFSRKTISDVSCATAIELKDNDDDDARVLYPIMWPGRAVTVTLSDGRVLGDAEITAALTTTQTAGGWSTELDLTAYAGLTATITYHPEAVAADTLRIPFQGGCSNSQFVGGYGDSGRVCVAIEASERANHRQECWQPECTNFSIGGASNGFGNKPTPPQDPTADWLTGLWTRQRWVASNTVAGASSYRYVQLSKPVGGGPSIQGLTGGWRDEVIAASDKPTKYPYDAAVFGKRVTWENDGNSYHGLVHGGLFARPDVLVPNGPDFTHDAASGYNAGCISGDAAFQAQADALGTQHSALLKLFPYRYVGSCGVDDYATTGGHRVNGVVASSAAYIAGVDRDATDGQLERHIKGTFE